MDPVIQAILDDIKALKKQISDLRAEIAAVKGEAEANDNSIKILEKKIPQELEVAKQALTKSVNEKIEEVKDIPAKVEAFKEEITTTKEELTKQVSDAVKSVNEQLTTVKTEVAEAVDEKLTEVQKEVTAKLGVINLDVKANADADIVIKDGIDKLNGLTDKLKTDLGNISENAALKAVIESAVNPVLAANELLKEKLSAIEGVIAGLNIESPNPDLPPILSWQTEVGLISEKLTALMKFVKYSTPEIVKELPKGVPTQHFKYDGQEYKFLSAGATIRVDDGQIVKLNYHQVLLDMNPNTLKLIVEKAARTIAKV